MLRVICNILGHRWSGFSQYTYLNNEGLAAVTKTCLRCRRDKIEIEPMGRPFYGQSKTKFGPVPRA